MTKMKLEDLKSQVGKEGGFKAPDFYLENFSVEIPHKRSLLQTLWKPALAIGVVVTGIISIWMLKPGSKETLEQYAMESIDTETLVEYYVATTADEQSDEVEFLLENEININDINEQLN